MNKPNLWGREPALILGAIQTILALAIAFGLDLSNEQTGAILACSAAVLAVVTRTQVTPSATVAAAAEAASPTGTVAGPAADVPEDTPVEVVSAVGDGLGTAVGGVVYGADSKVQAALHDGEYVITAKDVDSTGRGE